MKTGLWKVNFDITLEGLGVDFDELSEDSKRHILALMAQGCVAGEVIENNGEDGEDDE